VNEGQVILIALPQSDDRDKRRPALVLRRMPGFNDLLVCGISSRLSRAVPDFDLVLSSGSDDYAQSGLVTDSVIRLGYLTVIPASKASGAIGSVSHSTHRMLIERLCDYLKNTGNVA